MVITITNLLTLNNLENKAMNLISRLSKRLEIRNLSALILTMTAKFAVTMKRMQKDVNKSEELQNFGESLKKKLEDFKNMRRLK